MIRITGGKLKGRGVETPAHEKTRPTLSRLREALFSSIAAYVPDAKVLDLFSGSGAWGIEALSRGAAHVTFVESDRSVCQVIKRNLDQLQLTQQAQVRPQSVTTYFGKPSSDGFDLVFADPPYDQGWEAKLLEEWDWEKGLVPGGLFVLEWGKPKRVDLEKDSPLPQETRFLEKIREKVYGDSVLTTYQRKERK